MKYKIKHELHMSWLVPFILLILMSSPFFLLKNLDILLNPMILFTGLAVWILAGIFVVILLFSGNTYSTSVTVEKDCIHIKYLVIKKSINMSDIENVKIKRRSIPRVYKKYINKYHPYHYTEERLEMTIYLNNGKDVVLTDNATIVKEHNHSNIISYSHEYIADEDVPLFMAYQVIKDILETEQAY